MQYTHEHEEIQRTLKRFIDDEINPHVDEWEAAEEFPAHRVFKRLGELECARMEIAIEGVAETKVRNAAIGIARASGLDADHQ